MATTGGSSGPVILFTHEGISYEYLQSLGVGPNGEALLLARKRTADNILEDVIVKSLGLPPGEPTPETRRIRARLEEEARLAAYLSHRALVRVLCQHETQDTLYTVLESVHGPSLDDLVALALERERAFSEAFILHVGAELAAALDHVHTREDEHGKPLGIVHRNLSTETVRLTWSGEVKLADFGQAYSRLPGRHATTRRAPRGPLFFAAPESLFNGKLDARSDLFAVGLVLLEFATGRHLFDPAHKTHRDMRAALSPLERRLVDRAVRGALRMGHADSADQAIWGAATFTPGDVERLASPLSTPVKSILGRLLNREPAERLQTAAELEDLLRARLEEVGPYDGRAAVAEVKKALADAGEALVADELVPALLSPGPSRAGSPGQPTTR
ncbi:MAG: serine/threonine protein kinase [Myxococcaceae bacterium]|nr:serine/threonine protein kinase [Myxococcaceae bacterium]